MKLDNISKPKHYWYEDQDGNEIPWDINGPGNPFPDNYVNGEVYQHSMSLEVTHSICKQYKDPTWPIKILKWIISKMPKGWQGNSSQIYRGHSAIGSAYPIVKYLVDNRSFSFEQAAIIVSNLCSRCLNLCCWEIEGHDLSLEKHYLETTKTYCNYCKEIDLDHSDRHRVWCCYRTFKLGGDVAKAFKNVSVYRNENHTKNNGVCH